MQAKAFLFPRRGCFHDLQLYCQRLFALPGVPLKGPPALRAYVARPLTPFTLRSGDTFALLMPSLDLWFQISLSSRISICGAPIS